MRILIGVGVVGGRDGDEAQACTVGNNNGAESEGMGADRGDDEAAAVGREDGAATGERIGSGTCGRGHNDTIAGIGGYIKVVDIDLGA